MSTKERWLLPDGIEEVLPDDARRLEYLRRQTLDLFASWGYELVMPPMIEYIESLLTGLGEDLDLQTFKLIDQLTGRLMGIRPDMTPQAARIDAHYLKRNYPTRLCYLGPVLRTRPGDFAASREPFQVGAELFGHEGIESDIEVLMLMASTLQCTGVDNIHFSIGHVGVFRDICAAIGLNRDQEKGLFSVLQRKAASEVDALLQAYGVSTKNAAMVMVLLDLVGDAEVLDRAKKQLVKAPKSVLAAINDLQTLTASFSAQYPDIKLFVDLSDLSGYGYHTGIIFSAYTAGQGAAIAKGGRYDGIGQAFGNARPATGFTADLRQLNKITGAGTAELKGILAPFSNDTELTALIKQLRQQGERVVVNLPGAEACAADFGCDRELSKQNGSWTVNQI